LAQEQLVRSHLVKISRESYWFMVRYIGLRSTAAADGELDRRLRSDDDVDNDADDDDVESVDATHDTDAPPLPDR